MLDNWYRLFGEVESQERLTGWENSADSRDMRDEREWRDEVVIHSFHVAPFSHISRTPPLFQHARASMARTCGTTGQPRAGCSKRLSSKAAADESTGGVASGLR